jgi:hypothetical protein
VARRRTTRSAKSKWRFPTALHHRHPLDDEKDSGIKDFPICRKNVATTAGTTSERLLRKMNEDKK